MSLYLFKLFRFVLSIGILLLTYLLVYSLFKSPVDTLKQIDSLFTIDSNSLTKLNQLVRSKGPFIPIAILGLVNFNLTLALIFVNKYKAIIRESIYNAKQLILSNSINLIQGLKNKPWLITLIVIILLIKIFQLIIQPYNTDEAWIFRTFLNRSALRIVTNYELPSNHIFQTLLSRFSTFFLGYNLISARIPSFIAGIVLSLSFYKLARHRFSNNRSIILAIIFTTSNGVIISSSTARGYIFTFLFFIISILAILKLHSAKKGSFEIMLFHFVSFLGFICIPSYIFPYLISTLLLFMTLRKEKSRELKVFNLQCLLLSLITLFVYYLFLYQFGRINMEVISHVEVHFKTHYTQLMIVIEWLTGNIILSYFTLFLFIPYLYLIFRDRLKNNFFSRLNFLCIVISGITILTIPIQGRMLNFLIIPILFTLGTI